MKAAKIYALTWLIVLTGSVVLFGTGLMNEAMLPIFAFVVWTLIALGFVGILPLVLNRLFVPKL
ncbi:MAG: hypothetical protein IT174_00470 [Acidobacteria bacterium]|nr:hypothetical protein [Acidobacteriota bacterium]